MQISLFNIPYDDVKTIHVTNDDKSIHWNVTPIIKEFNYTIHDNNIRKFLTRVTQSRSKTPTIFTIGEFIINKNDHFGIFLYQIKNLNGHIQIRKIKRKMIF